MNIGQKYSIVKIHVHGKFVLACDFQHFMESLFTSVPCREFPFKPNLRNFSNFTWYRTKFANVSLEIRKNAEKLEKLQFLDFMFHANAEKWYHIHSRVSIYINFDHDKRHVLNLRQYIKITKYDFDRQHQDTTFYNGLKKKIEEVEDQI